MREYGATDLRALVEVMRESVWSSPSPRRERGPGGEVLPSTLYLVGNTSHLAEGWRERVPRFELGGDLGSPVADAVRNAGRVLGFPVVWETPAEVIPLPLGWEGRARPAAQVETPGLPFRILHFDAYSVVLRLVARGDEPDYLAALEYLRHGWVEEAQLEDLLGDLLPRFTNATLAQDPAEFRRKFKGLRQLRASVA